MSTLNKNRLYTYALLSIAFGIIWMFLSKSNNMYVRFLDALFFGGLISLLPGLLSYIRHIGMFDIFTYSFRLLRSYSKHFDDEQKDGPAYKTYHQFKLDKKAIPYKKEPVAVGGILIAASFLLSFLY